MATIPPAPACTPWCTDGHADDGTWDDSCPDTEYIKVCRTVVAKVGTWTVRLMRWVDFDVRADDMEVSEPEIHLDDEMISSEQIEALARALRQARDVQTGSPLVHVGRRLIRLGSL